MEYSTFILIITLYRPCVVGGIQPSKAGLVTSWAPTEDVLIIDSHKQKEHIEEIPKPVSFEVTTTVSRFIVNCKVYQWNWVWNPQAHYEHIYKVDLLSADDRVRFESLITNSCDQEDVRISIAHNEKTYEEGLKAILKTIFMVFMDQAGNCFERSYNIDTSSHYTATVTRSNMDIVQCPPEMITKLGKSRETLEKQYKGIVMDWTPEGKELITEYIKDSLEEEIVFTIPNSNNKYRVECTKITRSEGMMYTATVTSVGESTFLIDRLELTSCDEDNLKKTFSLGSGDEVYIYFITSESLCYKRTYETKQFKRNNYDYIILTRRNPNKIACPWPFPLLTT